MLRWMWLSTERPVRANSFPPFVLESILRGALWGQYLCRDADAQVGLCQPALRRGCAAGAQRQDVSARGRGLEKRHGRDGFALKLEELVGYLQWGM